MDKQFLQHPLEKKELHAENELGEISLEEREIVERIEKLKTRDFTKAIIMLVWKGLKPAAEFDFARYYNENDKTRLEQTEEIEKIFTDLGILYHRIKEEKDTIHLDREGNETPGKSYWDRFYIARDKDDLQYIIDYFGKENSKEIMGKMGQVFGYPISAVNAWNSENKRETILPWDYSKEPCNRDEMAFRQFRLSKANWKEEFELVKTWANEIKRLSPSIYKSIVQTYRHFEIEQKSIHGGH
jgi:hypothetical protein